MHTERDFIPLRLCVLTVSDSRTAAMTVPVITW
jgi:hypothetical protein